MAGLAPRAMLFDIRVAVEPGRVTSAAIAQGIVTAVRAGAAIINVSLLAPSLDPELGEAVTFAQARGCLIVAAGGNATAVQALTGYPGVLTVAAVNRAEALLRRPGRRGGAWGRAGLRRRDPSGAPGRGLRVRRQRQ